MKSYQCKVCGHIYSPDMGDPNSGVVEGTPFEELPDGWVCPICGVTKELFHIIEMKEEGL